MTLHAQERQDFLRRLADIAAALDAQIDYIDSVRRDLAQDDEPATTQSREALKSVRWHLGAAISRINEAETALPAPVTPKGTP